MSYYGISYSIPNLSGDRYLNFMIGGGIELGAYLLAYVVLNGIGRKLPLMVRGLPLSTYADFPAFWTPLPPLVRKFTQPRLTEPIDYVRIWAYTPPPPLSVRT